MCSTNAAYSSGSPSREGNGTEAASPSRTSSGNPLNIGVWISPGAIVITRIPARASSRAAWMSARSPGLGRGVGRLPDLPLVAGDRGGVDDEPALAVGAGFERRPSRLPPAAAC